MKILGSSRKAMNVIEQLAAQSAKIREKRIVAGYDGFVDTTVRPIAQAATATTPVRLFETISEFGEFLISKAEKSCSIELQVESCHLGGNMPFLSLGAGTLGLDVTCIGMLGEGGAVEDPFKDLPCTLYSFAPSGQSTCMEFHDGKVMLAPSCTLMEDGWELVMKATSGKAVELFRDCDLMALVNWSELSFSQELWQRTYQQVLKGTPCDKNRFAFFDLSDVSRKSKIELDNVLSLIQGFSRYRTTILSLNENEVHTIAGCVLTGKEDLSEIAIALRTRYAVDEILIHTIRQSLLVNGSGVFCKDTRFVEQPRISTGAGDHFNAASCLGAVMGLSEEERLQLANCVASYYVSHGHSPTLSQLI